MLEIHKDSDKQEQASNAEVSGLNGVFGDINENNANMNTGSKNPATMGISPFSNGFNFLDTSSGSEYVNKYVEAMKKFYAERGLGDKLHVLAIDKQNFPSMVYSYISVVSKIDDKIRFFVVVLEATGRAPLSVKQIVDENNRQKQVVNGFNQKNLYTTDMCIDNNLFRTIAAEINRVLGLTVTNDNVIYVDSCVIPHTAEANELSGFVAAAIAANAHNGDLSRKTKDNELNISLVTNDKNINAEFRATIDINGDASSKDMLGNPIRCDWKVLLEVADKNAQQDKVNVNGANSSYVLGESKGYIDLLPNNVTSDYMALQNGMFFMNPQQQQAVYRLTPQFIITDIFTKSPTTSNVLLNIIASTFMLDPNTYLNNIYNKLRHKIGDMNAIINLPNTDGKPLKLDDPKRSKEEIDVFLRGMIAHKPLLSFDIPLSGSNTYYTSVFTAAANSKNRNAKIKAAKDIIKSAYILTGGKFPENYDPENIFLTDGIIIPMGYFRDKDGEKDLRYIDTPTVFQLTQDVQATAKWVFSGFANNQYGLDAYNDRLAIMSTFTGDEAFVTGRAMRVTFSPMFIDTLIRAASEAGLKITNTSQFVTYNTYDFKNMEQLLANSYLGNQYQNVMTVNKPSFVNNFGNQFSHFGLNSGFRI
ncbi:hypothetical protein ACVWU4_000865 [Campylobacter coli]